MAMTASLNYREMQMHSRIREAGNAPGPFHDSIIPLLDQAYSFARFLSRDADGAQEIVEDAFLRAHEDYGDYRGGDPRAWLLRIVRNSYHDWLTARRRALLRVARHTDRGGGFAVSDLSADADMFAAGSEINRSALEQMARPLREVIILRELEDLSYRQIAEVTSLPITTIMSRLARARKKLRRGWRSHAASGSAALIAAAQDVPMI
jgi:RNA polymerase sigma factor (sigma-70 family)